MGVHPHPYGKGQCNLGEIGTHCNVQGLSVVNCANTAEPIDMPSGILSQVDPRNHVLHRGPDYPMKRGNADGKGHARRYSDVSCAKTAEPIEMLFQLWARVCSRNDVLHGVQIPHAKEQLMFRGRTCRGVPNDTLQRAVQNA